MSQFPLHFCNFPTNLLLVVPFAQIFIINIEIFYQVILKCYFKNLCFQLQQNVLWINEMMRVIFASTGINGVSLAHYISYTSTVTYQTDIVKFTLKVNPQGIQPTNMQLVRMYSTD